MSPGSRASSMLRDSDRCSGAKSSGWRGSRLRPEGRETESILQVLRALGYAFRVRRPASRDRMSRASGSVLRVVQDAAARLDRAVGATRLEADALIANRLGAQAHQPAAVGLSADRVILRREVMPLAIDSDEP